MPASGYYFDSLVRQPPVDDDNLNVEDNLEEFGPITDEVVHLLHGDAKLLLDVLSQLLFLLNASNVAQVHREE